MGLEGQVKLGYRNELAAIEDPEERMSRYQELVDRAGAVTPEAWVARHTD